MDMTTSPADDRMDEIRQLIRDARKRSGLSQSDVAKAMESRFSTGWYQSTVGRIESGTRALNVVEALTLAEIVGLDPSIISSIAPMPHPDSFIQLKRIHTLLLETRKDILECRVKITEANKQLQELSLRESAENSTIKDHLDWLNHHPENPISYDRFEEISSLLATAESQLEGLTEDVDPDLDTKRDYDPAVMQRADNPPSDVIFVDRNDSTNE